MKTNNMKTLAIYPGSFDPFHIGHLNIFRKAERIFGEGNVLIAIGINPDKKIISHGENGRIPSTSQKAYMRAKAISTKIRMEVEVYETFLHELIEKKESEGYNVVIVRGLRNGADLDYERNQLSYMNDFKKDINMVFITGDKEFEHISSSAIKKIEAFRPGSAEKYLI